VSTPIIAHRGASYLAPENTRGAFRRAWKEDADGIEGDFRLTADGHVVCLHDASTGRMAGVDKVVAECTLEELKTVDVGMGVSFRWMGQRIPTLPEVIATVPSGKKVFLEVKCGPEVIAPIQTTLEEAETLALEDVRLLAFDEEVVKAAKAAMPTVRVLWLTGYNRTEDGRLSPSAEEILAIIQRSGADGVGSAADSAIDEAFVNTFRAAGKEFHVWTIDEPEDGLHYAALGVDSITTNRPGGLRDEMGRAG